MDQLKKIYLAAMDEPLLNAFTQICGDIDLVEIHAGSILELEVDAVVSPANSFGFMDGGIDMAYSRHFGWGVQRRLQQKIRQHHQGELLVGTAEIVPTGDDRIPWLLSAPTMRVPMILTETVTPYLAARAVFLFRNHGLVREPSMENLPANEVVKSIAFPGLGTGVGRVPPSTCALQIRRAIEQFLIGSHEFPESWSDAQRDHQLLYSESTRDLQFDGCSSRPSSE